MLYFYNKSRSLISQIQVLIFMKIAFIGLGIMGSRMAANLVKNNADVIVFNRSEAPLMKLKSLGASVAESYLQAVKYADVVFTMLSTPEVVEKLMFGNKGCLSGMKENALWVDCSTVNPSFSIRSEKEAAKWHIRFMDIPVSGSKIQAENAELLLLAGGNEADLKEIEPVLGYMGKRIIYLGKSGMGTSFKMLVNAMLGESMLIFAETLQLGEKMGLTREFLLETLSELPVTAPFIKGKIGLIRENNFDVHFPLEWMHKDLNLVTRTATEMGQPVPLANLTREIYEEAVKNGLGREDFSAVYLHKVENPW